MDRGSRLSLTARAAAGLPVYLTGSTSLYRLHGIIAAEIPLHYNR